MKIPEAVGRQEPAAMQRVESRMAETEEPELVASPVEQLVKRVSRTLFGEESQREGEEPQEEVKVPILKLDLTPTRRPELAENVLSSPRPGSLKARPPPPAIVRKISLDLFGDEEESVTKNTAAVERAKRNRSASAKSPTKKAAGAAPAWAPAETEPAAAPPSPLEAAVGLFKKVSSALLPAAEPEETEVIRTVLHKKSGRLGLYKGGNYGTPQPPTPTHAPRSPIAECVLPPAAFGRQCSRDAATSARSGSTRANPRRAA